MHLAKIKGLEKQPDENPNTVERRKEEFKRLLDSIKADAESEGEHVTQAEILAKIGSSRPELLQYAPDFNN
jgi:hypothetical protein